MRQPHTRWTREPHNWRTWETVVCLLVGCAWMLAGLYLVGVLR